MKTNKTTTCYAMKNQVSDTGFIQASLNKIQGLLKDIPTVFKDHKFMKITNLSVKCLLQKC